MFDEFLQPCDRGFSTGNTLLPFYLSTSLLSIAVVRAFYSSSKGVDKATERNENNEMSK